MEVPPPDIEWFRSQISLARAHIDIAMGESRGESAVCGNASIAREICQAIAAALYRAQLAPGQRGEIEAELSSLRSRLQALDRREGA